MAVLIFFLLVFGGIVLSGFGRPSATTLALFSDTYAVPVTDENRALLERYIRGSRSCRMTGALLGAGAAVLVMARTDAGANLTGYLGIGYGLGAVVYELWRRPPGPGGASLGRRRISDYINPTIVRLLGVTALVGLVIYPLSWLFAYEPDPLNGWQLAGGTVDDFRTIGAIALCALALLSLAGRRIVTAPQPVISPAVDAAQHAVRTAGLMSLVGLALMASGILALGATDLAQRDVPQWLANVTMLIGIPLSLAASIAGFFLAIRSLPRFAPFWRELPDIEPAASA